MKNSSQTEKEILDESDGSMGKTQTDWCWIRLLHLGLSQPTESWPRTNENVHLFLFCTDGKMPFCVRRRFHFFRPKFFPSFSRLMLLMFTLGNTLTTSEAHNHSFTNSNSSPTHEHIQKEALRKNSSCWWILWGKVFQCQVYACLKNSRQTKTIRLIGRKDLEKFFHHLTSPSFLLRVFLWNLLFFSAFM